MKTELDLNEHWTDSEGRPAGGVTQGVGFTISWQNGPLGRVSDPERKEPNGAFVENIILAAIKRLEFYQSTQFECEENADALIKLYSALHSLEDRTQRRITADTEGTHEGN